LPSAWRSLAPSLFSTVLTSLTYLNCSKCGLTDTLENALRTLVGLPFLATLDLSFNFNDIQVVNWDRQSYPFGILVSGDSETSGVFEAVFSSLNTLILTGNSIVGNIPIFPRSVPSLKTLHLSYNPSLTGFIDDSWMNVQFLKFYGTSVEISPLTTYINGTFDPADHFESYHVQCPTFIGNYGQSIAVDLNYTQYAVCVCSKGYFGTGLNCLPCPIGTYRVFSISHITRDDIIQVNRPVFVTQCDSCPLGTFAASTGLSSCSVAAFEQYVPLNDASLSLPCAPNGVCGEGVLYGSDQNWVDGFYSNQNGDPIVYPCTHHRCQLYNDTLNEKMTELRLPYLSSWCSSNRIGSLTANTTDRVKLLRDYYSNIVCARCLDGFIEVSGECIQCDSYHVGNMALIWIASLLFVLFLRAVSQSADRASIKIFSFFVLTVRQLTPPSLIASIISALDLRLSFGNGTSTCIVPAHSVAIELWTMLALMLTWLNVLVAWSLEFSFRKWARSQSHLVFGDLSLVYLRTLLALITISVSSAIDSAMSMLFTFTVYRNNEAFTTRLIEYPDVDVNLPSYMPYRVVGIVIFAIFGIYMLMMFALLRYYVKVVYMATESLVSESVKMWHSAYKSEFYYAEVAMISRRAVLLLVARLMISSKSRHSVLNSVLMVMLAIVLKWQPYLHDDDNNLESFLLIDAILFVTFLSSDEQTRVIVPETMIILGILAFIFVMLRQFNIFERAKSFCSSNSSSSQVRTISSHVDPEQNDYLELAS
jgi:hypothetical protein